MRPLAPARRARPGSEVTNLLSTYSGTPYALLQRSFTKIGLCMTKNGRTSVGGGVRWRCVMRGPRMRARGPSTTARNEYYTCKGGTTTVNVTCHGHEDHKRSHEEQNRHAGGDGGVKCEWGRRRPGAVS